VSYYNGYRAWVRYGARHGGKGSDMHGYTADREAYLARLRRIEGQVRGLQRMVEEDKYCIDILTQVSAVTRALQREPPRAVRWRPRRSARRPRPSPAWSGPETGNCAVTSAGHRDTRGHCVHSVIEELTNLGEVSDAS